MFDVWLAWNVRARFLTACSRTRCMYLAIFGATLHIYSYSEVLSSPPWSEHIKRGRHSGKMWERERERERERKEELATLVKGQGNENMRERGDDLRVLTKGETGVKFQCHASVIPDSECLEHVFQAKLKPAKGLRATNEERSIILKSLLLLFRVSAKPFFWHCRQICHWGPGLPYSHLNKTLSRGRETEAICHEKK